MPLSMVNSGKQTLHSCGFDCSDSLQFSGRTRTDIGLGVVSVVTRLFVDDEEPKVV